MICFACAGTKDTSLPLDLLIPMIHYGKLLFLYVSISACVVCILHHQHLTPHCYKLTNKSPLIHNHHHKFILRLIFGKYSMHFNKYMMVYVYHFLEFVLHWKPSLSSILFYVSKTGRFLFLSELLTLAFRYLKLS